MSHLPRPARARAGLSLALALAVAGVSAACGPLDSPGAGSGTPSLVGQPGVSPSESAPAPGSASPSASASASGTPRTSGTGAARPTRRDKFTQPFSADSFWNTALGSNARYQKIDLGNPGLGIDTSYIFTVSLSDPQVPTYDIGDFVQGRCTGAKPQPQGQWHPNMDTQRVPRAALMPDSNPNPSQYFTPNSKAVFLMPDGRTVEQYTASCRKDPEGPLWGYRFPVTDIYGDGISGGGHGGSGLHAMGGQLREGELTGPDPIRHVLAINVSGNVLFYDHAADNGYRWPATTQDGYAKSGGYKGTNPQLKMGALVAIPPSVTADQLGLKTEVGRKLFAALRDYGAVFSDDSGQNVVDLNVDHREVAALKQKVTGGKDFWQYTPIQEDFAKIRAHLHVVTNNGPQSIGGGGERRQPPAPPL